MYVRRAGMKLRLCLLLLLVVLLVTDVADAKRRRKVSHSSRPHIQYFIYFTSFHILANSVFDAKQPISHHKVVMDSVGV